jgi:hypothetical protein
MATRAPRRARWYATLAPKAPEPTTTASAAAIIGGPPASSGIRGQPDRTGRGGEPGVERRQRRGPARRREGQVQRVGGAKRCRDQVEEEALGPAVST